MLKEVGVNRISFGVQSFNDHYLKILGRGHDALTARKALDLVLEAGFDNVAFDLMYRLPGQTIEEWKDDLDQAIRSGVHHISAYSLFVEPGSPLARVQHKGKLLPLPDDQTDLEMFRLTIEMLGEAGYELYTLYDFALAGKRCDHHIVNWHAPQAEYVGIGPGAFSFVRNGDDEFVYGNINPLGKYFASLRQGKIPIDFGIHLSREEQMARYMVLGVNGLRIPKHPFAARFGVSLDEIYGQTIAQLEEWGLVENSVDSLDLTLRGKLYLANVGKSFCTERNRMKPHPAGVDLQKGEGLSLIGVNQDWLKSR
jgi:oxygen-independent coproporphyrinogen-3 oxidase